VNHFLKTYRSKLAVLDSDDSLKTGMKTSLAIGLIMNSNVISYLVSASAGLLPKTGANER